MGLKFSIYTGNFKYFCSWYDDIFPVIEKPDGKKIPKWDKYQGGTQISFWWGVRHKVWNPYPYLRIFLLGEKKQLILLFFFFFFFFFLNFF